MWLKQRVPEKLTVFSFQGANARLRQIIAFQALDCARPAGKNSLKTDRSKLSIDCAADFLGQ
jgi:hypothetical protein